MIDQLSPNGWVGIGFHENNSIPLAKSNYSTAICFCSDQSFYNLQLIEKKPIATGIKYIIEANLNIGSISITGENGLNLKATGLQGKTLYPYFEFNGEHQLTILSYHKT